MGRSGWIRFLSLLRSSIHVHAYRSEPQKQALIYTFISENDAVNVWTVSLMLNLASLQFVSVVLLGVIMGDFRFVLKKLKCAYFVFHPL